MTPHVVISSEVEGVIANDEIQMPNAELNPNDQMTKESLGVLSDFVIPSSFDILSFVINR